MSLPVAVAAEQGRREGKRMACTTEGAVIERAVVDIIASVRDAARPPRFFPIPDDIEGALLTREGL